MQRRTVAASPFAARRLAQAGPAAAALVALLLSNPSASAVEPALARSTAGVLADVERIIDAEESSGWFLDAEAFEEVHPALMQTLCRATPEVRERALEEAEATRRRLGDPRALLARDHDPEAPSFLAALSAERRALALAHAVAAAGECPFWLEPSPEFQGRQTDRDRFTVGLETGGMLQVRRFEGRLSYGGGGAGRLLPAWGFGGAVTVLAGAEFGGGAMLEQGVTSESGARTQSFVINYFPALPVLVRVHGVAWHWDAELAPVAWFQASDTRLSFGGRAGLALGYSTLRTRGVLPWAGAHVAFEHYPSTDARGAAQFLRGGLRVGFQWDPE